MTASYTYSGNVYDSAAAGTTTFALTSSAGNSIGYLQKAHIHVYVSSDDGETWLEKPRPSEWDFNLEGTSVVLSSGITEGEWVRVLRITPIATRFVDFSEGSLLTAEQLDQGEDFSLYADQELADGLVNIDGTLTGFVEEAPQDGVLYGRQDLQWIQVPDPGISDAPIDNKEYVRLNGNWTELPADQTGVPEAPIDGNKYARSDASWVVVEPEGGIIYRGRADFTGTAPANPKNGDLYMNDVSGTGAWTGFAGEQVKEDDRALWNGSLWELISSSDVDNLWQRTRASAGSPYIIAPLALTDHVGTGGSATDPNVELRPEGVVRIRAGAGDKAQMLWVSNDESEGGTVEYTANLGWVFDSTKEEPDGSGNRKVTIGDEGTVTANDVVLKASRSSDWDLSGGVLFATQNYSENTFSITNTGEATARKSLTVGNTGNSGANLPGLIEGVGNSALTGVSTDVGMRLTFDSTTNFQVNYAGKVTAKVYDLESLPPLPATP